MARPSPTLERQQICDTLIRMHDRMVQVGHQIEYRLVGTGAALLQGVELPAADVDILVKNRSDVDAFAEALHSAKCLSEPTWLPETKQYCCNYQLEGIEIGASTVEVQTEVDTIETFGPGPWIHFKWIQCGAYSIPAVALELRLVTELYRNRPDRHTQIIEHLHKNGCDMNLLKRALNAARFDYSTLSKEIQNEVLSQL